MHDLKLCTFFICIGIMGVTSQQVMDDFQPTGGPGEYELSMCMQDLVACLGLDSGSPVCSVDEKNQFKIFDNLCVLLYTTCAGHGEWHLTDESSCGEEMENMTARIPTWKKQFKEARRRDGKEVK